MQVPGDSKNAGLFVGTSMGVATALLSCNRGFGDVGQESDRPKTVESPAVYAELTAKK